MPRAVSFAVTFSTEELARHFVREATKEHGVPVLRIETVVHVVAGCGDDMREILSIARRLGAEDL